MRWRGHLNPTLYKRICLNFCTAQAVGTQKPRALAPKPPGETCTIYCLQMYQSHQVIKHSTFEIGFQMQFQSINDGVNSHADARSERGTKCQRDICDNTVLTLTDTFLHCNHNGVTSTITDVKWHPCVYNANLLLCQ